MTKFNCSVSLPASIYGAYIWVNTRDFGAFRIIANASENAYADVTSIARGLKFGPSLHLQPCFVEASNKGSNESAHIDSPEHSLLPDVIRVRNLVRWSIRSYSFQLAIIIIKTVSSSNING